MSTRYLAFKNPTMKYYYRYGPKYKVHALEIIEFKKNPEYLFDIYIHQKEKAQQILNLDSWVNINIFFYYYKDKFFSYNDHFTYIDWDKKITNDVNIICSDDIPSGSSKMECSVSCEDNIYECKQIFENFSIHDFIVFNSKNKLFFNIIKQQDFNTQYKKITK